MQREKLTKKTVFKFKRLENPFKSPSYLVDPTLTSFTTTLSGFLPY
jgi:hypothetical protein